VLGFLWFVVVFLLIFLLWLGSWKENRVPILGSLDNHMLTEQERGRGTAEFNFL
jgi:hypothetical protein